MLFRSVESTFAANQAVSEEAPESTFEYGISLDDFTSPEIHIESNDHMQTSDGDSISHKNHHNFSDAERSTSDKLVTDQSPPEGPFDCNTNSDMSLDEDSKQAMEAESALERPQSIPRQVCVLFTETSASAAMRRPTEFPCTVTMPDGVTELIITAQMAEKAEKAIAECTMMPLTSTQ